MKKRYPKEERIVAQLLHKYGLIPTFLEGGNLHVRVGDSRSTLDFKVGSFFLEYHPLSIRDRDEGITIEEAGDQKRARVQPARYPITTAEEDVFSLAV